MLAAGGTIQVWSQDPEQPPIPILTDVPSSTFARVGMGYDHACAVRTDDQIECRGADIEGHASPPGGPRTRRLT